MKEATRGGSFATQNLTKSIWEVDDRPSSPQLGGVTSKSAEHTRREPKIRHKIQGRRLAMDTFQAVQQCGTPNWKWPSELDNSDFSGLNLNMEDGGLFDASDDELPYMDVAGRLEGDTDLSHSPTIYQFYGRSRTRTSSSDTVHFILLGPNIDHWKTVGQILASRGFNAVACERVQDTQEGNDAPNLVMDVMEGLKWGRAVVVGCDTESTLAIETALMLAPDQVAGLILCGDQTESYQFAREAGIHELDSFLGQVLGCPFVIVTGGEASKGQEIEGRSNDRCSILGGGSAPHRLKPDQFAWALTRFVEERLDISARRRHIKQHSRRNEASLLHFPKSLPLGITSIVSPEGRLLLGRAVASTLIYITLMKVVFVQYGLLRAGLIGIKTRYDSLGALGRKAFQSIYAFIVNFGYIPRIFKLKKAPEDGDDAVLTMKDRTTEKDSEKEEVVETADSSELGDESAVVEEESEEEEQDEEKKGDFEERRIKPFFFLDNVIA